MNEERRFEELARIDEWNDACGQPDFNGFEYDRQMAIYRIPAFQQNGDWDWFDCADYNSYDPLHRIVKGMPKSRLVKYYYHLQAIIDPRGLLCADDAAMLMLQATVEQMQEAILRACGKWEEPKWGCLSCGAEFDSAEQCPTCGGDDVAPIKGEE